MEIVLFSDEYFMREALKEAQNGLLDGEVPVGAVIVCNQKVIARAHNLTERLNDVTAHADMQAITAAANHLGAKYLKDCTLYVTLEPCTMCSGALHWSQIGKVVYGANDPKKGFLSNGGKMHPKTEIVGGVSHSECSEILIEFFQKKRK